MSITSNAQTKILNNKDELLGVLGEIGLNVENLKDIDPAFKKVADNNKECQKRWCQAHKDKMREYWLKYRNSEKGRKTIREWQQRYYQNPEIKAKKRERNKKREALPEIKEKRRFNIRTLNIANKTIEDYENKIKPFVNKSFTLSEIENQFIETIKNNFPDKDEIFYNSFKLYVHFYVQYMQHKKEFKLCLLKEIRNNEKENHD